MPFFQSTDRCRDLSDLSIYPVRIGIQAIASSSFKPEMVVSSLLLFCSQSHFQSVSMHLSTWRAWNVWYICHRLASRPWSAMIRSSLPRFRVQRRWRSSWHVTHQLVQLQVMATSTCPFDKHKEATKFAQVYCILQHPSAALTCFNYFQILGVVFFLYVSKPTRLSLPSASRCACPPPLALRERCDGGCIHPRAHQRLLHCYKMLQDATRLATSKTRIILRRCDVHQWSPGLFQSIRPCKWRASQPCQSLQLQCEFELGIR